MRTSSHHQPEAQHPKSPAIETPAGRLPHLCLSAQSGHRASFKRGVYKIAGSLLHVRMLRWINQYDTRLPPSTTAPTPSILG